MTQELVADRNTPSNTEKQIYLHELEGWVTELENVAQCVSVCVHPQPATVVQQEHAVLVASGHGLGL